MPLSLAEKCFSLYAFLSGSIDFYLSSIVIVIRHNIRYNIELAVACLPYI